MKKRGVCFFFLWILALFLSGCSSNDSTTICSQCRDEVSRWIDGEDPICATCFVDMGYNICKECRLAYQSGMDNGADGYCGRCMVQYVYSCEYCETQLAIEHMADLGNGHYLCGNCLFNLLDEFCDAEIVIEDGTIIYLPDYIKETSIYNPRQEYLERLG